MQFWWCKGELKCRLLGTQSRKQSFEEVIHRNKVLFARALYFMLCLQYFLYLVSLRGDDLPVMCGLLNLVGRGIWL